MWLPPTGAINAVATCPLWTVTTRIKIADRKARKAAAAAAAGSGGDAGADAAAAVSEGGDAEEGAEAGTCVGYRWWCSETNKSG